MLEKLWKTKKWLLSIPLVKVKSNCLEQTWLLMKQPHILKSLFVMMLIDDLWSSFLIGSINYRVGFEIPSLNYRVGGIEKSKQK